MRFRIAPTITAALVVMAVTLTTMPVAAQDVEKAQRQLDSAAQKAREAESLVDEAVANRAEIEAQLAESIARSQDLAAALTEVGSNLDSLRDRVSQADLQIAGITQQLQDTAVESYMDALGGSTSLSLVSTASVEEALVVSTVISDFIRRGRVDAAELFARRQSLEDLQQIYLDQETEYQRLKESLDAEIQHLVELYEEADEQVAQAIRRQQQAASEYQAALSRVQQAHLREEERRRQEERPGITTPPATTTTTRPRASTTTTTVGTTTSTTTSQGNWSFPPAVERWRGLVEQYFPASRVDEALAIMRCESGGDPDALNPYSDAAGLFQFLPSTWATTAPKAGFPDASPFDAEANIASAAWLGKRYEALGEYFWRAWSCRRVLQ